jgi:conjugal transfer/type IV secretion protein DotA/TraY
MILPGVIPRIREFAESGFSWLAFLMASIYAAVRLLPPNHPYLRPENKGRFGLRHVIAEAANNLVIKRENADQIVMFGVLLLGFVLVALQVGMTIFALAIHPVYAQMPPNFDFQGMFTTVNKEQDIAFMLLDKVFAVPNFFGSIEDPATAGMTPFSVGLHQLFAYYDLAILLVAVAVFLYYVVIVVGETASTGTPFGKRFAHIWAPLRLVFAVGMLVPVNYGYNTAQYLTLYAARTGSGFATNAWLGFNASLASSANSNVLGIGDNNSLIANPKAVDIQGLVSYMSIVATCVHAYDMQSKTKGQPDLPMKAYWVRSGKTAEEAGSYEEAITYYDNHDIVVRFGHLETENPNNPNPGPNPGQAPYSRQVSGVNPYCGEITIHLNDVVANSGTAMIQEQYYQVIIGMWAEGSVAGTVSGTSSNLADFAETVVHVLLPAAGGNNQAAQQMPDAQVKQAMVDKWYNMFNQIMPQVRKAQVDSITDFQMSKELLDHGWGGAGIWYNKIAQWNGSLFAATYNVPTPSEMPTVMKISEKERLRHDENVDSKYRYQPFLSNGQEVKFNRDGEGEIARVLSKVYEYWQVPLSTHSSDSQVTGNIFFDVLNGILGTQGLFHMRDNLDVHPLAQLVAMGRSMLESTIRNLLISLAFSFGAGVGDMIDPHLGGALNAVSGMFVAMASVGLTLGFVLFYVLPFLPFMYFYFAVGNWVKSVFEAMVGVPLWALAHLRIDGNGFSSESATNGYFLLFEIFLRPILTVFGLIAGLMIFAAMAKTLNLIFDLVTTNLTGFDCQDCGNAASTGRMYKRNVIDEFFFTAVYTIIIYMMATSSFKLIDQIPAQIMRWLGSGVRSFSGQTGDPESQMMQYVAYGGKHVADNAIGAMTSGAKLGGNVLGSPFKLLAGRNKHVSTAEGATQARKAGQAGLTTTKKN